jgi:putative heme degradation protein
LPDHRKEVLDACLAARHVPLMMELLPAIDADAIQASMDLVDQADIHGMLKRHDAGRQRATRCVVMSPRASPCHPEGEHVILSAAKDLALLLKCRIRSEILRCAQDDMIRRSG